MFLIFAVQIICVIFRKYSIVIVYLNCFVKCNLTRCVRPNYLVCKILTITSIDFTNTAPVREQLVYNKKQRFKASVKMEITFSNKNK